MSKERRLSQSLDQAQALETVLKETVQNFQHELNGMLGQVNSTMEDLKKASLHNGNQLKAEYTKGFADIQAQLNKATADMIGAFTKNYTELKESLKENYDALYGQAKNNIDKNMQRFKATVPPVLASLPSQHQKMFQDMIKTMEDNSAKTLKSLENSYKEMMLNLDKTYQEGLKIMQSGQAASQAIGLSGAKNTNGGPSTRRAV